MAMRTPLQIPTGLILYIAPLPFCILSLWSPRFPLRGPFFSILILLALFMAQFYPFGNDARLRYGLMLPWYIYFGTVAKILFCIPEESFWRLGHERKEAMRMKIWGWQKLKWMESGVVVLDAGRGMELSSQGYSSIGEWKGDKGGVSLEATLEVHLAVLGY
jgi:hypothetical protein